MSRIVPSFLRSTYHHFSSAYAGDHACAPKRYSVQARACPWHSILSLQIHLPLQFRHWTSDFRPQTFLYRKLTLEVFSDLYLFVISGHFLPFSLMSEVYGLMSESRIFLPRVDISALQVKIGMSLK
jgi:hypothetical protein